MKSYACLYSSSLAGGQRAELFTHCSGSRSLLHVVTHTYVAAIVPKTTPPHETERRPPPPHPKANETPWHCCTPIRPVFLCPLNKPRALAPPLRLLLQDAKLAKLDNMDEDELDKLRERRKAQLIAAQKTKQVGHRFCDAACFLYSCRFCAHVDKIGFPPSHVYKDTVTKKIGPSHTLS